METSTRPQKPHFEFFHVDLIGGWTRPDGYPDGFEEKILASDIDEVAKTGSRSRLLRLAPGARSYKPFLHDYWEEVYVMEGDLVVGIDAEGNGGEEYAAPTYACRPPGILHGPVRTLGGCVMFEIHYYTPTNEAQR